MSQVSVVEVPLVPVLACWGSRQWSCGILWGQTRHFLARHRLPILSCSPIWHISLKTRFVFRIHQFTSHRLLEKMPPKKEKSEAKKHASKHMKFSEGVGAAPRYLEILGLREPLACLWYFVRNNAINAARHEFDFPQTNLSIHFIGGVFFPDFWKMTPRTRRVFLPNQNTLSCTFFIPLWMQWQ